MWNHKIKQKKKISLLLAILILLIIMAQTKLNSACCPDSLTCPHFPGVKMEGQTIGLPCMRHLVGEK